MAEMYIYKEDDQDDGYGDGESSLMNPDDQLTPIQKLEKYGDSDHVYNREQVARTILETLRVVSCQPEDVAAVLNVMNKLADDTEQGVRAELMEQVPHIAMYCQEFKSILELVVPQHLLPMVVKFLSDAKTRVRKTSQAALLVLLEQGLVEKYDVQEQVCPVIINLTESNSHDDFRTETVALLSKMAPYIGKEMTEEIFLSRFASLCCDPLFHVRKVCAANFGDFASVVGCEATERYLLPKFFYLCEDGVWGVRTACADVFMQVSCLCSAEVRRTELAPLFISLLRDQSRWVRMAAFKALGPFISTFADPTITALLHNDNGEIVISDPILMAQRLEELELHREDERRAEEERKLQQKALEVTYPVHSSTVVVDMDVDTDEEGGQKISTLIAQSKSMDSISLEEERAKSFQTKTLPTSDSFNNFQYWREEVQVLTLTDLPSVEANTPASAQQPEKENVAGSASLDDDDDDDDEAMEELEPIFSEGEYADTSRDLYKMDVHLDKVLQNCNNEMDHSNRGLQVVGISDDDDDTDLWRSDMELFRYGNNQKSPMTTSLDQSREIPRPSLKTPMCAADLQPPDLALPKGPPEVDQDIVPQLLIDHYVSMTDPSRAQTVDSEIARHCAFALPAVSLTLGRSNWPLLKETYIALASDMQWKVRKTLASSIHELAIILGERVAEIDLIPIFNGFFRDLDEVRIGILKHLADFLKMLNSEARREYLPRIADFLKMDNDRNWRFRQELADQVGMMVPLFNPQEVKEHLAPIALFLIQDKVSAIRLSAVAVHIEMCRTLLESENPALAQTLLNELVNHLAGHEKWVHRQTFAFLCLNVFGDATLDPSRIVEEVLPKMLDLAWDKVPNVRLAVAKAICQIKETDFYKTAASDSMLERIEEATACLSNDKDSDVRSIFNPPASPTEKIYDSDGDTSIDIGSLPV